MQAPDVAIIGGGVIGLAIAWQLAGAGMRVTVYERDRLGGQASGAAAGLLAPVSEHLTPDDFLALGIASLRSYPDFVSAVREESGIDPELVQSGVLRVALSDGEAETLSRTATGTLQTVVLDAQAARELEPALSPQTVSGLFAPDESHVASPRLVAALGVAARRRGARILEGTPVGRIIRDKDRVVGVETPSGPEPAGAVVLAAGAWSAVLTGPALGVTPIRGQILALEGNTAPLSRPVFGAGSYLAPKRDGTIWAGATEDRAGFSPYPTARGVRTILAGAERLAPAVAEAAFVRAWAGLRPATPDRLPILGRAADGLVLATGHHRNGILLAPITAEIVAALVLGNPPPIDLGPFSPDRFAPRET